MIPGIEKDPDALLRLANARMPAGRYKGELLLDLPPEYVYWFTDSGKAPGAAVMAQLATIYSMRFNGQERILRALVEGNESSGNRAPRHGEEDEETQQPDELDWMLALLDLE
ncbi:MAG: hypothetical protein EA427_01060 [Spirochaetaceae bacterium]|nr:MAG: hypothetical protein EA427_01060 [Spirochaetaceae bacterium]